MGRLRARGWLPAHRQPKLCQMDVYPDNYGPGYMPRPCGKPAIAVGFRLHGGATNVCKDCLVAAGREQLSFPAAYGVLVRRPPLWWTGERWEAELELPW